MIRSRRPSGRPLRRLLALVAASAVVLLGAVAPAEAHPISTSAVLLDVESNLVTGTVELPLDELGVAQDRAFTAASVLDTRTLTQLRAYLQAHMSASDATGQAWTTAVTGGRVEKVDGIDDLVLDATLTPASGSVGDFVLHDDAVMDQLVSHRVFVSGRYGRTGSYTTLAMLSWQSQSVPVVAVTATAAPVAPADQGLVSAVRLGVHHIASGSDHLMFLIMLLLPAPLVAAGRRWRPGPDTGLAGVRRSSVRVVHVVTAFATGHSCTLALGALGWVSLPTRLVESGIAVSVLVSAIHAVRPLVRRGEVLIAGAFGLLHGLAFATLLGSLDLSRTSLVTTLLGFNVGIEVTQLLVVALVMPSLVLLSRTRAYPAVRVGLATTGAVLASGWLAERLALIDGSPADRVGDLLVEHPLALAVGLSLLALVVTVARGARRTRVLAKTGRAPAPLRRDLELDRTSSGSSSRRPT